ncbi:hypothetical protein Tco_1517799 [Tanacetum coccineum]
MAALRYRDEHNKVGYLQKPKGSDDYHQILNFLGASHIRSPELGPPAILATIDATPYTITEDSVRGQLQSAGDLSRNSRVINSPCYHNKELASPEQTATAEVVPKSVAGSSFPAASSTLLPFDVQICAEVSCVQVKTQADWMLLYVVPTGRVVVPTGRYVVPAGKVIFIVSPSRLNLVPTGRILSPGKVK